MRVSIDVVLDSELVFQTSDRLEFFFAAVEASPRPSPEISHN